MKPDHFGFTNKEVRKFRSLKNPYGIQRFLDDMPSALGEKPMRALAGISDALGLDYAGVDFGLDGDDNLLLFEANATMVIAKPGPEPHWAYRQVAVDRILAAVTKMITTKAGGKPL